MNRSMAALVALSLLVGVVGCGSSSSEESDTDEGALGNCISIGFLGTCRDTGEKTKPQGWPIPAMVRVYSDHFDVPAAVLNHPKMTPLPLNPAAVGAEIKTSTADGQGITCDKSGAKPGSCSFSLLVEASLVKDASGALVPYSSSPKPVTFGVNGRVAELLLEVSQDGKIGPLACKKTPKGANCTTAEPFGTIVSVYAPNTDTAKALAEASLEPPTAAR